MGRFGDGAWIIFGEALLQFFNQFCIENVLDLIGVAIIVFGFNVALIKLVAALGEGVGLRKSLGVGNIERVRTMLGTYILTGIEFMIASDIIHTVITREFTDLLFVGLLVIIRTAISFFLGREIMELNELPDRT